SLVHGDIKGENILVNDAGHACLADFGISSFIQADDAPSVDSQTTAIPLSSNSTSSSALRGTVSFLSPEELMNGGRKKMPSDVWKTGCTAIQIIAGNTPYEGVSNHRDLVLKITDGVFPMDFQQYAASPEERKLWKIIEQCWKFEPESRPSDLRLSRYVWILHDIWSKTLYFKTTFLQHRKYKRPSALEPYEPENPRVLWKRRAEYKTPYFVDKKGKKKRNAQGMAQLLARENENEDSNRHVYIVAIDRNLEKDMDSVWQKRLDLVRDHEDAVYVEDRTLDQELWKLIRVTLYDLAKRKPRETEVLRAWPSSVLSRWELVKEN
ncbi:hypothetical protein FRC02_007557, partial [Tulasnella sp. 418]